MKVSDLKMYIIVRNDLDVSVGKAMVHSAHAVLSLYVHNQGNSQYKARIDEWFECYQTKIILGIKNESKLRELHDSVPEVMGREFPRAMVEDEGFYEVEKGTVICLAVGPMTKDETTKLGLNKLSLYKK